MPCKAIINCGFDRRAHSLRSGLDASQGSKTVQSQKDEADINKIVRDFGVTGVLKQGVRIPTYGDFDSVSDYRTAIHAVREAQASFDALPSQLRNRFNNDPQEFIAFAANPDNKKEMADLGLLKPVEHVPVPPAPQE